MAAHPPKLIVTLGPATRAEESLRKIKDKGVDFIRINMSHSSIEDLSYFLTFARILELPFILDTEGSQLRTGTLERDIPLEAGARLRLHRSAVIADDLGVTIKPAEVIDQLRVTDLLFVGFGTLVLRIIDVEPLAEGYVQADVISTGMLSQNKAIVVVSASRRLIRPPVLTEKDYRAIALGLHEGVEHLALSYVRRGEDVDVARLAANNAMQIISKIESWESLEHFDDIMKKSDYLLLDRGDLSKEVAIERIPLIQKEVIERAKTHGTPIYVATNFLESMVWNVNPTRAEVSDVVNTILDGADGLILSAETAVGAYPMECINMMKRLMEQAKTASFRSKPSVQDDLDSIGLPRPHGGQLVDRFIEARPERIDQLLRITLSDESLMDLEQIAVGALSPLKGFMNEEDFHSVADRMRLADGEIWPIPIVLDVSEQIAKSVHIGDSLLLCEELGNAVGILHVEDIYRYDKDVLAIKVLNTIDPVDPGVRKLKSMAPVLVGGPVDMWALRTSGHKAYELTPRQTRRLFQDRGWSKIAGFQHGSVLFREDEFLQMCTLDEEYCDGLFLQPRVDTRRPGDLETETIVGAYENTMRDLYPRGKVVFSLFPTRWRYAGARETLLRAICQRNFGCSHFVLDRDRAAAGDSHQLGASSDICDLISDLGVHPIVLGTTYYLRRWRESLRLQGLPTEGHGEELRISGAEARRMMETLHAPPSWYMRPEISAAVLQALRNEEPVFVKESRS